MRRIRYHLQIKFSIRTYKLNDWKNNLLMKKSTGKCLINKQANTWKESSWKAFRLLRKSKVDPWKIIRCCVVLCRKTQCHTGFCRLISKTTTAKFNFSWWYVLQQKNMSVESKEKILCSSESPNRQRFIMKIKTGK